MCKVYMVAAIGIGLNNSSIVLMDSEINDFQRNRAAKSLSMLKQVGLIHGKINYTRFNDVLDAMVIGVI